MGRQDGESRQAYEIRMVAEERFEAWRKAVGDSRLKIRRVSIASPLGPLVPLYCLNCGAPGGAVTANTPDVAYICRPCAAKYGGLPAPEVPAELIHDNPERG